MSDRALVLRARGGDQEAFRALYDLWSPPVLGLLRHLLRGDRARAEEALEETFVRAFAALGQFDVERPLGPWIKEIARNVVRDGQRAEVGALRRFDATADWKFAELESERKVAVGGGSIRVIERRSQRGDRGTLGVKLEPEPGELVLSARIDFLPGAPISVGPLLPGVDRWYTHDGDPWDTSVLVDGEVASLSSLPAKRLIAKELGQPNFIFDCVVEAVAANGDPELALVLANTTGTESEDALVESAFNHFDARTAEALIAHVAEDPLRYRIYVAAPDGTIERRPPVARPVLFLKQRELKLLARIPDAVQGTRMGRLLSLYRGTTLLRDEILAVANQHAGDAIDALLRDPSFDGAGEYAAESFVVSMNSNAHAELLKRLNNVDAPLAVTLGYAITRGDADAIEKAFTRLREDLSSRRRKP